MQRIFLTSDTHLYHASILKYESRPFASVEEMNKTILRNWNKVVKKDDLVYHLGDVSLGNHDETAQIIRQLNGRLILIMGNHDKDHSVDWWHSVGFHEVSRNPQCLDGFFWISHEPMYLNGCMPYVNAHGHLHGQKMEGEQYINMCMENWNFTPVLFDDLKKKYKA